MPRGIPKTSRRRSPTRATAAIAVAQEPPVRTVVKRAGLQWRRDREMFRVWSPQMDAYGQFEVLDRADFAELERFCRMFSIDLVEVGDDE